MENIDEKTAQVLQETLDRHGYGFHYSVLKQADNLALKGKSQWSLEAAEFPVEVRGSSTRIDFILERRLGRSPLLMVAECKRANPAIANWLFVRAPYALSDGPAHRDLFFERVLPGERGRIRTVAKSVPVGGRFYTYQVAIDAKTPNEKGDSGASGRGAIEEAATQVLRGMNGLVNSFAEHFQQVPADGVDILPAIFTTAALFTSEVDLGAADLHTGKSELIRAGITKQPWLLLNYHMSPGLKHLQTLYLQTAEKPRTLSDVLRSEYLRTIAVVSPSGIEDFLLWSSALDLHW